MFNPPLHEGGRELNFTYLAKMSYIYPQNICGKFHDCSYKFRGSSTGGRVAGRPGGGRLKIMIAKLRLRRSILKCFLTVQL